MGLIAIFLGIILLILFVGIGFYVNNMLGTLFLAMPNLFGDINPTIVIVGVFAAIGLIICIGYVMSGVALLKVNSLKKRLR